MKTVQYSNLKTINIDSDIFTQESSPARSKLPLQLLKSLAQRKRTNKRNLNSRGESYTLNFLKARAVEVNAQLKSQSSINDLSQPAKAIEMFTRKTHTKTIPQISKGRSFNLTDTNFKRHNQSFCSRNDSQHQFADLRETRQCIKSKLIESNQKAHQQHLQYQCLRENNQKINPYTQQPYSYLTHKERDQLYQIKRATRFRRVSSITKSYKVVTIQLAAPEHHRRPSVHNSPRKMSSPIKNLFQTKKLIQRREVEQKSPSPWQWGLQQSKDYLQ